MKPYTIERLERAIAVVQATHAENFDLGQVFDGTREDAENHICGTSACALGHCAIDPWFNERGLSLAWDWTKQLQIMIDRGDETLVYSPVAYELAGAEFFGLTESQAYRLFRPSEHNERYPSDDYDVPVPDRSIWLSRARRLLAQLESEAA